MKDNTTVNSVPAMIGFDLGDKFHHFCMLDKEGEIIQEGKISNTSGALATMFQSRPPCTAAMETGTHSPWISQLLEGWGHKVMVGNARKLRAVFSNKFKSDRADAEMIARIARADPKLFYPIHHRGEKAQADLAVLKSRDLLVSARTDMINHCRGIEKAFGKRLPSCSAEAFAKKVKEDISEGLHLSTALILKTIEELNSNIKLADHKIAQLNKDYAETEKLRKVNGVGSLTSLCFILTLEEPERFEKSRTVPVFIGLVPRRDQSGEIDKQLPITKAGNAMLRRLLVSSAQYILGHYGQDCDLRRWGLKICERGGKSAKKRAVIAVARKLSVLLHRLWLSEEPYDPFRESKRKEKRAEQKQVPEEQSDLEEPQTASQTERKNTLTPNQETKQLIVPKQTTKQKRRNTSSQTPQKRTSSI